ncbi:MAG: hypothetical protein ABR526_05895 [Chthoniobacterales bacterium]
MQLAKNFRCACLLGAIAFTSSIVASLAAPADDVAKALRSGGSGEVSSATPEQLSAAYTAVASRVNVRELPEYVAAAIQLRPDLSTQTTAASIKAALRNSPGQPVVTAIVYRIVQAAILANSGAAVAIARAAVVAAPGLRDTSISAAVAAAPDQRLAILQATNIGASIAGIFRSGIGERTFSVGFGRSGLATFSDTQGNVSSPEQPPSHP